MSRAKRIGQRKKRMGRHTGILAVMCAVLLLCVTACGKSSASENRTPEIPVEGEPGVSGDETQGTLENKTPSGEGESPANTPNTAQKVPSWIDEAWAEFEEQRDVIPNTVYSRDYIGFLDLLAEGGVAAKDYDGDGLEDRLYQRSGWHLFFGDGAYLQLGNNYVTVIGADFTGDGKNEIVSAIYVPGADNTGYSKVLVFEKTDGEWQQMILPYTTDDAYSVEGQRLYLAVSKEMLDENHMQITMPDAGITRVVELWHDDRDHLMTEQTAEHGSVFIYALPDEEEGYWKLRVVSMLGSEALNGVDSSMRYLIWELVYRDGEWVIKGVEESKIEEYFGKWYLKLDAERTESSLRSHTSLEELLGSDPADNYLYISINREGNLSWREGGLEGWCEFSAFSAEPDNVQELTFHRTDRPEEIFTIRRVVEEERVYAVLDYQGEELYWRASEWSYELEQEVIDRWIETWESELPTKEGDYFPGKPEIVQELRELMMQTIWMDAMPLYDGTQSLEIYIRDFREGAKEYIGRIDNTKTDTGDQYSLYRNTDGGFSWQHAHEHYYNEHAFSALERSFSKEHAALYLQVTISTEWSEEASGWRGNYQTRKTDRNICSAAFAYMDALYQQENGLNPGTLKGEIWLMADESGTLNGECYIRLEGREAIKVLLEIDELAYWGDVPNYTVIEEWETVLTEETINNAGVKISCELNFIMPNVIVCR